MKNNYPSDKPSSTDLTTQLKWENARSAFIVKNITASVNYSSEEQTKSLYEFVNEVGDVLKDALKAARVRDSWDDGTFYLNVQGFTVLCQSNRTRSQYNLGFGPNGCYLQYWPEYLNNLRYMGDKFWAECIQLFNHPNFQLQILELAGNTFASNARRALGNHKSKLFTLMREYMLHEIADSPVKASSFASFEMFWPIDVERSILVRELSQNIRAVWKLDYELWKVSYQKANKASGQTNISRTD